MFSAPRYRGPKSAHFDGKRFQNQERTDHQDFLKVLKWGLTRKPGAWPPYRDKEPGLPPPERVHGDELRVTFVNHATVLVQTAGLNLLTDPVWGERTSPVSWAGPRRVRPPGIRLEDLPPIDAVLLSHNHYDHLDVGTLRQLATTVQPPQVLTGLGNSQLVETCGLESRDLDWWESAELDGGVKVTFAPARHFSGRGTGDRDATLWGSFVVETPGGAIYFAGDTGWGRHFEQVRERFGPMRLALLPIGAFRPEWFMAPVHISPAEAVKAHDVLEAQVSVAIHFGTFKLADDGFDEPVEGLKDALASRPSVVFWVLEPGEGRAVPAAPGGARAAAEVAEIPI